MLSSAIQILDKLRTSYWFMPMVMVLGALAALTGLVWIDAQDPLGSTDGFAWLRWGTPEGVRVLLAAIAGSMITVAGVTFSVTILVVSYASTQLGPRLLTNFLQDRGNQITLGTFIATFLYSLLLMRVVDGGAKTVDAAKLAAPFVPHFAVTFAVVLTVVSTFVLIYFLHHVPSSIHTSNVVASLGYQLISQIDAAFPEVIEAGDSDPAPYAPNGEPVPVPANEGGYLQYVDLGALTRQATGLKGRFHLAIQPGDYVGAGEAMLWVVADGPLDDADRDRAHGCFTLSARRTPEHDLAFLIDEICEIATRALSPGINDPYTAMACVDWLTSAFGRLSQRAPMTAVRRDDDGIVRLVTRSISFEALVDHALGQLRPYVARDRNAVLHLQRRLGRLLIESVEGARRPFMLAHLRILEDYATPHLHQHDLRALATRNAQLASAVAAGAGADFTLTHPWLTGRR